MIETGQLLATKILVSVEKIEEKKSSGGLILPNTRKLPNVSGKVIKTGVGTEAIPMPVKEGDTVFYFERSAVPVVLFDTDYLLLDCRDILFLIPGKL
jgi:co-chaperonin GroES (HSP10)